MTGRSAVEQLDRRATNGIASARAHPLTKLLGGISEIADQPPLIALSATVLAAGLMLRRRRLAEAGGRMLAAELVATALKSAIKNRIDRTRPHVEADGGRYRAEQGDSDESALNSFPSGHTAGAVAVSRAIGRVYPAARWPALTAAGAIASIQLPRLKHYPTDLAAGAAIGLVADAIVTVALDRLQPWVSPRPEPSGGSRD